MQNKNTAGHLLALITILLWGTTFISTKILLQGFKPIEILFFRFAMGFIALWAVYPHRLKVRDRHHELLFIVAGFTGITLYYLFENIALTYTMAANVGVIVSVSPFFTAIFTYIFMRGDEKPRISFFAGFIASMAGILLINYNGTSNFKLNPLGDFLAFAAAIVWSLYSVITRKIAVLGYNTIQTTRRTFAYGLIFMLPAMFIFGFNPDISKFADTSYLFNIIFLGLGASALCFVTWNFSVRILGAVKTSIYIYMIPAITVVTSFIVLHEKITIMSAIGTVLTIAGLFISESKLNFKKRGKRRRYAKREMRHND